MNRTLWVPVLVFSFAAAAIAGDDASSIPDDCDLLAAAVPHGAARETVEGKLRIRFQILVKDVVLGRIPEGRVLPVLVGDPLPEGWKEAGRAVVEPEGRVFMFFLKSVGTGRDGHFVPVGEGLAAVDEARIRGFREAFAPRVKQALLDIDSEDFQIRETAEKLLYRLGYAAEEAVREVLKGEPSPEVAMRAKRILQGLPRRGTGGGRWFIHQPDVNYPDDDVLIWQSPSRDRRAFLLKPGTEVEIKEKVDGDKFGSPHVMFKIRTKDGREGWVPEKWLRYEAGSDEIRPLGPGEEMTPAFVERVWMAAMEEWMGEFKEADDKSGVKGFDKYLDDYSKKAGFEGWADFATNAARSLGAQAWGETVQKMTNTMTQKLEKITKEMAEKAKEKAEKDEGNKKEDD